MSCSARNREPPVRAAVGADLIAEQRPPALVRLPLKAAAREPGVAALTPASATVTAISVLPANPGCAVRCCSCRADAAANTILRPVLTAERLTDPSRLVLPGRGGVHCPGVEDQPFILR